MTAARWLLAPALMWAGYTWGSHLLTLGLRDVVAVPYSMKSSAPNLVAVLECTSREMIPRQFQNLDRQKVISDIRDLKVLLGERDTL